MTGGATSAFEAAADRAGAALSPTQLRVLADRIAAGAPDEAVRGAVPVPGFAAAAGDLLAARRAAATPAGEAAAYLRGLAAGHAAATDAVRVESVWSGPSSHPVPVRATAQVLVELIGQARHELLLMTYSAKDHPPMTAALAAAVDRGVAVTAVVETLAGAGSALSGAEPAAAFRAVPQVELWHWPVEQRSREGAGPARPAASAKMHAKLAVADRRLMLVSSANLTQSGVDHNIEAGLLVRGGAAPRRAAEHIAELKARAILARLRPGR